MSQVDDFKLAGPGDFLQHSSIPSMTEMNKGAIKSNVYLTEIHEVNMEQQDLYQDLLTQKDGEIFDIMKNINEEKVYIKNISESLSKNRLSTKPSILRGPQSSIKANMKNSESGGADGSTHYNVLSADGDGVTPDASLNPLSKQNDVISPHRSGLLKNRFQSLDR